MSSVVNRTTRATRAYCPQAAPGLALITPERARIVCSSDAGVTPNKPHHVLPHGVTGFLPRIGMTNAQALAAVTSVPADVGGIAEVAGTLEPGKDADIMAVVGNPLEDLAAIHDVVAVFARGVRVHLHKEERASS